jgi:hypothetical protein
VTNMETLAPTTEDDTWAQGDTCQDMVPAAINLVELIVRGGPINATTTLGGLFLQNLTLLDSSGTPGLSGCVVSSPGCYSVLDGCTIQPYIALNDPTSFTTACNCIYAGGGEGGVNATFYAGCVLQGSAGMAWNGGVLDGDLAIDSSSTVANQTTLGLVDIGASATLFVPILTYLGPATSGLVTLWGSGIVDARRGGIVANVSGNPYAATVYATMQLDEQTTGTSYNAGTFTDGVALTAANVDANGGLQNPKTGARYC